MTKTKKRLVIKNRVRFTIFVILAAVVVNIMFFALVPETTSADISHKTDVVYVCSGDTLWDIANEYVDDGDVREMIYRIKKLNKLSSANLVAGQSILVPLD